MKKILLLLIIFIIAGTALAWAFGIRVDLVALKNRSTTTGYEETIELIGDRMVHGVIEVENDEVIVLGHGLGERTEILTKDIVNRYPVEGSKREPSDFSDVIYQDKNKNKLSVLTDFFEQQSDDKQVLASKMENRMSQIQRDMAWRNGGQQALDAELDRQAQALLQGIAKGSSKKESKKSMSIHDDWG